jgi:hypothetical protein
LAHLLSGHAPCALQSAVLLGEALLALFVDASAKANNAGMAGSIVLAPLAGAQYRGKTSKVPQN